MGGIIAGSFLVRHLHLTEMCHRSAKMCFILSSIALLSIPAFYIPGCRTLKFAGVNVAYHNSSTVDSSLQAYCNRNCSCSRLNYNPVCGMDDFTYYSPCQAGCTGKAGSNGYTNCSCIQVPYNSTPGGVVQATEGFCDMKCKNFVVFMITICIGLLSFGLAITPVRTVLIRCVPENQRAYAMGFQVVVLKIFAFLPAPVVFGSYFDSKCILWEDNCGGQGSCLYYNKSSLDVWLQVFSTVSLVLGAVLFYFSWKLYKAPPTEKTSDDETTEEILLSNREEVFITRE